MADELNQNVETQESQVEKTEEKETKSTEKTYTLSEVQALLNAKNHEKEARKSAQAELKSLKEENAKLKGEDSISKFNENKLAEIEAELNQLKQEKIEWENKEADNQLKDELRKIQGLIPQSIDDVLDKAKRRGFKLTEVGYVDKDGKTLTNFVDDIKENYSYYFGLSANKNVGLPQKMKLAIENAKKTGSTLGILQEGFKNVDLLHKNK